MKTFDELHKEHPTPWTWWLPESDKRIRGIRDANGELMSLSKVTEMMNLAVVENGCLDGWRQLCRRLIGTSPEISPECVAACIKAVEATRDAKQMTCSASNHIAWLEAKQDADRHVESFMDHAISLLPKRDGQ